MDKLDKFLLEEVQFNFPVTAKPYREIGKRLGLSEKEVINRLIRLKENGVIRYIGAIFNTAKLGMESTLIAAQVSSGDLKRISAIINKFDNVSHNYLREGSRFNLWFTVTAPSGKLERVIKKIRTITGMKNIMSLRNRRTFKIDVRFRLNG